MLCEVIDHPLVRVRVGVLRDQSTGAELFRRTLREISVCLAVEATRDLDVVKTSVQTPLAEAESYRLARGITVVPILRAGLGMAEAILGLIPEARVGHVGVYRDEITLEPQPYYEKGPQSIGDDVVLVVDPMLATGNSSAYAVDRVKQLGARDIRLLCIIGAPEGVSRFSAAHPNVPIFLAALDQRLNEYGYIVPGLGDAGDRYFGTV